jgi:hypothetical protein
MKPDKATIIYMEEWVRKSLKKKKKFFAWLRQIYFSG